MRVGLRILIVLVSAASFGATFPAAPAFSGFTYELWEAGTGLPQNSVQALAQSRDGYLWIGTLGGLTRFDGVRFTTYDKYNTPELGDNVIQSLLVDRRNRLWIATGSGLAQMANGRFSRFTRAQGLPGETIWSLLEDSRGRVWVGTQSGIAIFSGDRFELFEAADAAFRGAVFSMHEDADGTMWVGSENARLLRVQGSQQTVFGAEDGLPETAIRTITRDALGELWVGTDDGLYRLEKGRFVRKDADLRNEVVRALAVDSDGALLVGTYSGLTRMTRTGAATLGSREGLSSDTIRSLFIDREKNIWIGTGGGGLLRLRKALVRSLTAEEGLSNDIARAVMQTRDGAFWVGTYGGGLNRVEGERVTTYRKSDGLPDDVVYSLAEGPDGALWIGTRKGLAVLRGGKVSRVAAGAEFDSIPIRGLHVDPDGTVWIGTVGKALFSLAPSGAVKHFGNAEGITHPSVFFVKRMRDRSLWIATHGGGIFRLDSNGVRQFTTRDGLPNDRIWAFHEDKEGTIWIGTRGGGLARYRDGKFSFFTTATGMFDDVIYHILEDAEDRLWLSGNRGIFWVEKRQLEEVSNGQRATVITHSIGKAEGMRSTECNGGAQPSGWVTKNGELWFPTLKGIAIIDSTKVVRPTSVPPVVLESVIADGKIYLPGSKITLAPGTERLDLHYTALLLGAPQSLVFRYRLEGFDREWIDATQDRFARYTNLAPGNYRFLVESSLKGTKISSKPAVLEFSLKPFFYQTRAFFLLCLAAFMTLIVAAFVLRVRASKRRELQLLTIVTERTSELEAVNERLRELTTIDPLTGISNRRHFDEFLQIEWRRALRDSTYLTILFIDIDHFKAYNDAYGHQLGDEALRKVASVIGDAGKRAGDLVARYGGEEFAVVLHKTNPEQAGRMADELRLQVEELGMDSAPGAPSPFVTISIGVATTVPSPDLEADTIVAVADEMLYAAKRGGRNRVRSTLVASESLNRSGA